MVVVGGASSLDGQLTILVDRGTNTIRRLPWWWAEATVAGCSQTQVIRMIERGRIDLDKTKRSVGFHGAVIVFDRLLESTRRHASDGMDTRVGREERECHHS